LISCRRRARSFDLGAAAAFFTQSFESGRCGLPGRCFQHDFAEKFTSTAAAE
jgi:hypothetical protein